MSDDTVIEKHESYGMVGLSRFTCGGGRGLNLFGSSIMSTDAFRGISKGQGRSSQT